MGYIHGIGTTKGIEMIHWTVMILEEHNPIECGSGGQMEMGMFIGPEKDKIIANRWME